MARAGEAGGQGGAGRTHVYAVSNSGFFDPGRNRGALGTIRLFAGAMGYSYGQGLALEGGPVIPMMPGRARLGKWPLGSHHKALRALAGNIGSLGSAPDSHAQPDMPRFMYNLAAGQYFRGLAKRNGLRRRDLSP